MANELLHHFQGKQKSVKERIAHGEAMRKKYPHKKMGDYKPSPQRADPVAILEKQAKTRLPELIPIRYARMLASPFAFLRGAAAIMAQDLAAQGASSKLFVQACGDM